MKSRLPRVIGSAIGTAAFAILTGQALVAEQSPAPAPSTQANRALTDQATTLSGCIQSEADYRRAIGAGLGGVASTGIGAGNEFVLTNAIAAVGSSTAPAAGNSAPSPTGTAGTTGGAYELSGSREGDAAAFVGKRVEITGTLKPAASASGGLTADLPGSQDLKLREFEVTSIRAAVGGTCPAAAVR